MPRRFLSVGSWCAALLVMLASASIASAAAPVLQSAVSRMTHGSAGTFDVQLPLTGNTGIECRRVDLGMTIVMTYDVTPTSNGNPIVTGATFGTRTIASNVVTVTLTNVVGPTVTVNANVKNGSNVSTGVATCRILGGDVNSDGIVNTGDVNGVRFFVANGYPVDGTSYRCDVDLSGVLNGGDINYIRGQASISASVAGGATADIAPTLTGPIANMTALRGQTTSPVSFTVANNNAGGNSSALGVLISSSDQSTIPNSSVVVTGSGTSRSFTITPAATPITTTTVTLTLEASDGLLTSSPISFTVTVSPAPTVFLATLAPIPGVTSLASGSATLIVSGDQTHANLTYSFSNLAGADVDDQIYAPGAVGLYDVPTLAHANNVQPDGSILWTFKANAIALDISTIFSNTAYMQINSSANLNGELQGTFQKVVGSQTFTPPAAPPTISIDPPSPADASRLLQQGGFGGTIAEINALSNPSSATASTAIETWIANQEASAPPISPNYGAVSPKNTVNGVVTTNPNYAGRTFSSSSMYNNLFNRCTQAQSAPDPNAPGGDQPGGFISTNVDDMNNEKWWSNAVTAPDELRQRVATAYSELFVVSQIDTNVDFNSAGLATYYDMLANDAFVNFRQLLGDVTLHPIMGDYLNMAGNDYFPALGAFAPNENYAREIMQLFTIGLYMLQPDGTLMLNSSGQPIATYTQPTVTSFAAVYTGWDDDPGSDLTWPFLGPGTTVTTLSINENGYYTSPMVQTVHNPANYPYATLGHYTVAKSLLNYPGAATFPAASQPAYIPANSNQTVATATQELNFALDNIFNHPNVGPFVCKQLIQRLVTSNPSPAYVYRVAQVFNNDGTGTRGNMAAVFKAMLTDYEARSPVIRQDPGFGKVREPTLRIAQILHCFQAKSHTGKYIFGNTSNDTNPLGESLFWSPTVFNFYTPTYQQPGTIQQAGLVSPEMNIYYETTIVNAQNLIYYGIYSAYTSTGAPSYTGNGFSQNNNGFFAYGPGGVPYPFGADDILLDFSTATGCGLLNMVQTSGIAATVDQVGLMLMGCDPPGGANQMDPNMRSTIINYVTSNVGSTNYIGQVEAIVHLVATSSQATIQN